MKSMDRRLAALRPDMQRRFEEMWATFMARVDQVLTPAEVDTWLDAMARWTRDDPSFNEEELRVDLKLHADEEAARLLEQVERFSAALEGLGKVAS